MDCYHCYEPGHFKADCPFLAPCGYTEHLARIERFVSNWISDLITIEQKRRLISDENLLFYGPSCRKALLYP